MLKDTEGNNIKLSRIPNEHILTLGRSGMGKTYFLCRKMEEAIQQDKRVVVFDYSESYSLQELKKNQIKCIEKVTILDPVKEPIDFRFSAENIKSGLSNALFKVLVMQGFYQKKLLREAINEIFYKGAKFSIPMLIRILEYFSIMKDEDEDRLNISRLLSKLDLYSEIENIFISSSTESMIKEAGILIIQLSNYGEMQRKFCVEFLAELFWQDVRAGRKRGDIFVLDEFHNMKLGPGTALSAMLREGRKFELAVWLASQFLGNYDKENVETLLQVGNKIFFKPTENDEHLVADFIAPDEHTAWRNILRKLAIGEVVLKGNYFLNDKEKMLETPIICKIEAERSCGTLKQNVRNKGIVFVPKGGGETK